MFCKECGAEINDKAAICTKCGCYTDNHQATTQEIINTLTAQKNIAIAYILWFILGWFGIHRLYLGRTGSGVAMLICGVLSIFLGILLLPLLAMLIWWIVDACLIPSIIASQNNPITKVITKSTNNI
ncbi:NINE protein [Francisellaceae bacterium CB299]|jgi:TM2 domain-containing membrane protein YozV